MDRQDSSLPSCATGEKRRRRREKEPKQKRYVLVGVEVPLEKMGFVVGKQFSNVRRLEERYHVQVIIPDKGCTVIKLKGPADRVDAARKDILDSMPEHQITHPVERRYIGYLIGNKGERIRGLSRRHHVKIRFDRPRGTVTIKGVSGCCNLALHEINLIVDEVREMEAARAERE